MKNIILEIFHENGFEKFKTQQTNNIEFWGPSKAKQSLEAYFIVDYLDDSEFTNVDEVKEKFIKYYNIINDSEIQKSAMEKNTYIIICLKVNITSLGKEIRQGIFDIEEDPQKFKKHVLLYTENQVNLFNNIRKSYNTTTNALYDILNSDHFQEFKKNPENDSLYSLVAGFFIKLPFLRYKGQERMIDDLASVIFKKIHEIGEDKSLLVNKIIKIDIDRIKSMNTNEIISLLKGGFKQ
ncbi:hypothetical protein GTO89_15040 [Heliobacterium gestii]|uniref:Uncharacterized protein n=1 Tax=Heliomicrobium gestii TaxID=2699 RepID=A0A845LC08_HELGE|nr:ABC-three component system middle component 1 [Heliomicrobium gestii]MBM7868125.1 hypothetical protein [Heliomicrobium gestii]MZP44347.1 hypothetical protein [Heliomicrobium gestii]